MCAAEEEAEERAPPVAESNPGPADHVTTLPERDTKAEERATAPPDRGGVSPERDPTPTERGAEGIDRGRERTVERLADGRGDGELFPLNVL